MAVPAPPPAPPQAPRGSARMDMNPGGSRLSTETECSGLSPTSLTEGFLEEEAYEWGCLCLGGWRWEWRWALGAPKVVEAKRSLRGRKLSFSGGIWPAWGVLETSSECGRPHRPMEMPGLTSPTGNSNLTRAASSPPLREWRAMLPGGRPKVTAGLGLPTQVPVGGGEGDTSRDPELGEGRDALQRKWGFSFWWQTTKVPFAFCKVAITPNLNRNLKDWMIKFLKI